MPSLDDKNDDKISTFVQFLGSMSQAFYEVKNHLNSLSYDSNTPMDGFIPQAYLRYVQREL